MKTLKLFIAISIFCLCIAAMNTAAQPTAFTYQGRLTDNSIPADGAFPMQFSLHNSETPTMGDQLIAPLTFDGSNAVRVTNGIFTVQLNFEATGSCPTCFDGSERWLQIAVKKPNESTFTLLVPRQRITSTPYAIRSKVAGNALNLNGTPASQYIREGDSRLTDPRPPAPNSDNYIQNQNSSDQSASFRINGGGIIGGNLGIGTTAPGEKLDVGSATGFSGSIRLSSPSGGLSNIDFFDGNVAGRIQYFHPTDEMDFMVASSTRLKIKNNGNVGIGTVAPAYPLTVSGSAGSFADQAAVEFSNGVPDTGVRIRNTASGGRTWTLFSSGGTTGIGPGNFTIYDATAAQSRLSIDSAGNVGIGTPSPSGKLHVAGNLTVNGALSLNGNQGQAGQIATSNGPGAAAQWKSPTNTLYQRTNMSVSIDRIAPTTPTLVPGLSQTINVPGNAKLLVQFGVRARTGLCQFCDPEDTLIDVILNGNRVHRVSQDINNNLGSASISGSHLLTVGAGNHTIEIHASNSRGAVYFGCQPLTSSCASESNLIVQVIPE